MITSGDFTTSKPIGSPSFSGPFEAMGVPTKYVLRQQFMQSIASFAPLTLDTPHPVYDTFLLVEETQVEDVGCGVGRWTRIYAKKPETFSRPSGNYTYNFIGFSGQFGLNVTPVSGRARFNRNVPTRLQRDFFLIGPGKDYETFQEIPTIQAQRYVIATDAITDTDYIGDSPPFEATTPSRTDYAALVATDGEIVPETSKVEVWMGNIYIRETLYIKAQ